MSSALDQFMTTARAIEARADRDRAERQKARQRGASSQPVTSLGAIAAALLPASPTPPIGIPRPYAPVDQLEQLERELLQLLATSAPATWRAHRRLLSRVLRGARRELRAIARAIPT